METRGDTPKAWADTSDLAGLLEQPGPYLTVQLATEASIDNASQRNQLRWRDRREQLVAERVDEAALAFIDPLVEDAHLSGQTLFAVATPFALLHVSHWPELPTHELGRFGPLPSFGPLIELRQSRPPHVVVVADRVGADIWAVTAEGVVAEEQAGGDERPIRKVHAGGWSMRRYQNRAENTWQHNAEDVAAVVQDLAAKVGARLIVAAGDTRAVQLLEQALPEERRGDLVVLDGSRAKDGSEPVDQTELAEVLDRAAADATEALLTKLEEEAGQHDRGAVGASATVRALTMAQVEVLLVRDDPDDDRLLWFGPQPTHVALHSHDLDGLGADERVAARFPDVLIRSALLTSAAVRVLPDQHPVPDGAAAILRWTQA